MQKIMTVNNSPIVAVLPHTNGREFVVVIHNTNSNDFGTGYWTPGCDFWTSGAYHYATIHDAINAALWLCGMDLTRQNKPAVKDQPSKGETV